MKMMRMKILCAVFGALAIVGCSKAPKPDATGTFEATEVVISSEIPGKLLQFSKVEGDAVEAGEIVAVVDTVQLYLSRLQLMKSDMSIRSNAPDVSAQIAALQAQIAKQQYERRRVESLLKAKAATTKQLDDISSSITVLNGQLEALKSNLKNNIQSINAQSSATRIQIAQIDDKLSKCHILSPISGTILAKYAEAGEYVNAGRPLLKIADMQQVYLRVYLTARQLDKIKLGDNVKVKANGSGKRYNGRITWIASISEFTPKNIQTTDERENLVYAVKILIRNDGGVKLGMYGDLYLK